MLAGRNCGGGKSDRQRRERIAAAGLARLWGRQGEQRAMRTVFVLIAVLLIAAAVWFAPRCNPGDDGVRIGGVMVYGCK